MAGNQEDIYSFTLQFKKTWPPQQLIREGRMKDPLKQNDLRTVSINNYEEAIRYPEILIQTSFDFRLDDHELIVPAWSSGLSTYTDENRLRHVLRVREERLWKLGPSDDARQIFYPAEMQLKQDKRDPTHFGINPKERMRPEKFKQMLRCLPWVKLYPKNT
ncbi:uncharacterized protein [Montipora capricornis]|uniref:uncharacterized protein n=1 Tax=Montipora capricornis TaxID=246305 RepID=UPI0035F15C94